MSETLCRAYEFAAIRHAGQRRKGAAAEPYINHPIEVAALVSWATGGRDDNLVAAAVLHDTIEDTETSAGEIRARFGDDVARLVLEVTKERLPAGRQAERAAALRRVAGASRRAQILKLADLVSNMRSLANSPPVGWSFEDRFAYIRHAYAMRRALEGAHDGLWRQLDIEASRAIFALTLDRSAPGDGAADGAGGEDRQRARRLRQQEDRTIDDLRHRIADVVPDPADAEEALVRVLSMLLRSERDGEEGESGERGG